MGREANARGRFMGTWTRTALLVLFASTQVHFSLQIPILGALLYYKRDDIFRFSYMQACGRRCRQVATFYFFFSFFVPFFASYEISTYIYFVIACDNIRLRWRILVGIYRTVVRVFSLQQTWRPHPNIFLQQVCVVAVQVIQIFAQMIAGNVIDKEIIRRVIWDFKVVVINQNERGFLNVKNHQHIRKWKRFWGARSDWNIISMWWKNEF